MEVRKTLKLTNQNQFEADLKYMNKADFKKDWNVIADKLNSKGPPIRDGDGWQKLWADFEFEVKNCSIILYPTP